MNEEDIGAIVVRLRAENEQYKKAMEEAAVTTKDTGEAILSVKNHLDGFGKSLSRFAELAVAAIALRALKGFFHESIAAWKETEDNAIKLNAVLEANKRDVELVTESYNEFASGIQKLTTTSDDATIALLAQAESFGLSGAAAEKAVKDAMGFAAMNDGNAAAYLRFTAAMASGNTEMMQRFARMIPQLRGITDETKLMEKATLLAATGFETAQRQAGTLSGMLTQLKNAWGDIMEEVGRTLSGIFKPVVAVIRGVVDFLGSFSSQAKEAATSILLVAAAMASIGPIVAAYKATLGPLFTMTDDGFRLAAKAVMLVINPMNLVRGAIYGVRLAMLAVSKSMSFMTGWGAVLAIAGVVIGVIIDQLGGFSEAWDKIKATALAAWDVIKQAASEFWEWLQPIGSAALGVLAAAWEVISEVVLAVWDVIVEAATVVWDFITEMWTSIAGDAQVNWETVRDFIIDALLTAEFYIGRFGKVWDVAVAGAALAIVVLWEDLKYFFTVQVPTTLDWFFRNWKSIFMDIWDFTETVFKNLADNIVEIIKAIPDLISGDISFGDLWKPLTEGFKRATEELVIPERIASDLEKELKREFEIANNALNEGWEEFRDRRRKEIFTVRQEDVRERPIPESIRQDAEEAKKQIDNLQAVLRNSAEGLSRAIRFREAVNGPRVNPAGRMVPSNNNAAAANTTEAVRRSNTFLERIEGHLANIRRRGNNAPDINVAELNP